MFKKVKKLKLTQQLFLVTIVSLCLFLLFFFFFLTKNIQMEVNAQLLVNLQRTQEQITKQYEIDKEDFSIRFSSDPYITHIIYDASTKETMYTDQKIFDQTVMNQMDDSLNEYIHSNIDEVKAEVIENNKYVYRIQRMGADKIILSITSNASVETLKTSLMNSMLLVSLFIMIVLFVILGRWITTILRPLLQTKKYIEALKDGKDMELKITRDDEIGDLMHAVVDMHNELMKQDEVKQDMIHNISHDLKTPISTIKSYAESINDGVYPYETLEKSIDVIIDNSIRLEHKVHSLLTMNRVDYLLSQEGSMVNIKKIIEKIVRNAEAKITHIQMKLTLEEVSFRGNSEAWQVAVENIFDNALRYAKSTIVVELKEGYLAISNDGVPLSKDRIPYLFKPFEKGFAGEFGLGLSISDKIAKSTGYRIVAENTKFGVCFKIEDIYDKGV